VCVCVCVCVGRVGIRGCMWGSECDGVCVCVVSGDQRVHVGIIM
jgi:hypothetical protein